MHAAFLASIIETPSDDTPRLIYADWLEEQSDPALNARGEFIRVQVELAQSILLSKKELKAETFPGQAALHHQGAPRRLALVQRERELLNGRAWGWAGKALRDAAVAGTHWQDALVFRRGFIDEIICTAADFLQHADALRAATPLRKARLTTLPDLVFNTATIRVALRDYRMDDLNTPVRRYQPDGHLKLLQHYFPGLEFELPPQARNAWALIATYDAALRALRG